MSRFLHGIRNVYNYTRLFYEYNGNVVIKYGVVSDKIKLYNVIKWVFVVHSYLKTFTIILWLKSD